MDQDDDDTTTGDKLQLRLLLLEDRERSALMWRQVSAFQEKVTVCLDTFDPEALLVHVRSLSSLPNQNPILATSIHSLARLRMVVQQQLRRASMRSDGTIYFTAEQQASVNARCTQYFVWFFDFMDYLAELHSNFVERIFLPLFKFFHEIGFLSRQGRASTSTSTFSKLSQFSLDSGDTDDNEFANDGNEEQGDAVTVETARKKQQSKAALMLLSKEFADIKTLYDTSEMDKVAQRLSFLKEQVEFMLEEEDEVDPDLFSADSGQLLFSLRMDEGTENLVRLPLDLLVKFRKATWLARRWLQLYDKRTHDLSAKLQKVLVLEDSLTKRLRSLDGQITTHERQLERQTEDLNRLMEREERSEALKFSLYDVAARSGALKQQLEALRTQRDAITARVMEVARLGHTHEYRRMQVDFQKNKLQRYLLERQLATIEYQRQLSEQDQSLELQMRPGLIRHTNHVQDTCERLEQRLRDKKRERETIRNALLPIQEDRQMLRDRLSRDSSIRDGQDTGRSQYGKGLRAGEAKYVRTVQGHVKRHARPSRTESYRAPKPSRPAVAPGWMTPPQW